MCLTKLESREKKNPNTLYLNPQVSNSNRQNNVEKNTSPQRSAGRRLEGGNILGGGDAPNGGLQWAEHESTENPKEHFGLEERRKTTTTRTRLVLPLKKILHK